jgi:thiamine monophosphate kinase
LARAVATLTDLGERALIRRLLAIYGEAEERGLGDDAAFLPVGDRYLLLATDSINARTHIPPGVAGDQVGWYAAAASPRGSPATRWAGTRPP